MSERYQVKGLRVQEYTIYVYIYKAQTTNRPAKLYTSSDSARCLQVQIQVAEAMAGGFNVLENMAAIIRSGGPLAALAMQLLLVCCRIKPSFPETAAAFGLPPVILLDGLV